MPLNLLAPWLLTIAVTAAGFAFTHWQTLKLPRWYLLYVTVSGSFQLAVYTLAPAYQFKVFWFCDIAHNVILCAVCLELLTVLLPEKLVIGWSVFGLGLFVVGAIRVGKPETTDAMLNLTVAALFTAGLLLAALLFVPDAPWSKETARATAGAVAVMVGCLLPNLAWMKGAQGPGQTLALQLGPLLGLAVLSWPRRRYAEVTP
jgi:hypothetical protein